MNEFKSKTNIIWLCNPYKTEVQSFLYLKAWSVYFKLNELKSKANIIWLSNPYETKARYNLSCTWKPEVSTFKLTN